MAGRWRPLGHACGTWLAQAAREAQLDAAAQQLGCSFASPFMYMIFLSVTAIPDFAMTDLGLIDCVNLRVISPILGPAA